jgi:hypothetical protein
VVLRSFDADRLNSLVNHPSIRPFVGGKGELDLTRAVGLDCNYFLEGEHGGFFFEWSAPDTHEVHTFILPEGRGVWAFEFALSARAYMAGVTEHLWTRVPVADRHTRIFTLKAGFRRCGEQSLDFGDGDVAYELFNWRRGCPQEQ